MSMSPWARHPARSPTAGSPPAGARATTSLPAPRQRRSRPGVPDGCSADVEPRCDQEALAGAFEDDPSETQRHAFDAETATLEVDGRRRRRGLDGDVGTGQVGAGRVVDQADGPGEAAPSGHLDLDADGAGLEDVQAAGAL